MNTLLHLPYSPWSEKARWALDARRVEHRRRTYQPLIGEPGLRVALRQWRGRVSVPVLFTDAGPIPDSFAIAHFADQHGDGPSLFPAGSDALIASYNRDSERGLAAGRVLSLARVRVNDAALLELVPRPMRKLGPAAVVIARFGVDRTLRKYGGHEVGAAEARATLREVLGRMRQDLAAAPAAADGGPKTLLGRFSYADVTMAQVLVFVAPPSRDYVRIGTGNRAAFADAELATEFADLVAWRDALYAHYRRPGSASTVN
jgi:glutathione S-transferase